MRLALIAVCLAFLGLSGVVAAGIDAGAPAPDLELTPRADVAPPGVVIDDGGRDAETSMIIALARMIVDAAKHRNWRLLVGLALSLVVLVLRWIVVKKLPWPRVSAWVASDLGGVALLLLTSVATALSTLLLSRTALTADHVVDCLINALVAAGGYTTLKKLWAAVTAMRTKPATP